jgi:chromosome segregation ATPase
LDRINELLEQLSKKFADKKDTKKALKLLEKQIKNLYDLIMSMRNQGGENEDDAMFTKKPLGGMSCASCEKNIVNL